MKELVLSKECPPIYARLKSAFGDAVDWDKGVIICDGFSIHCKYDIEPQKIIHELCHAKRQEEIGKELWWDMFLNDKDFRWKQESEAYFKEAEFLKKNVTDRNVCFKMLWELCEQISSPMYGKMCTFDEAKTLLL